MQDERPSGTVLTPREQAVFNLLRDGLPNKLIAHRLNMSISTVKIHVHHVMQKLRARNRAQVAGLARPPDPSPAIRIAGPMNGRGPMNGEEVADLGITLPTPGTRPGRE